MGRKFRARFVRRGTAFMALVVAAFVIAMALALLQILGAAARRQSRFLTEARRQEACRSQWRKVETRLLRPHGYPRIPRPGLPWSWPCHAAEGCPGQAEDLGDGIRARAVPTADGYAVTTWDSGGKVCDGDFFFRTDW